MVIKRIVLFFHVAAAVSLTSCGNISMKKDAHGVYVDEAFTRMYMPDSGGVTSADGTISFQLLDGSSIFMTGDCFTGDVVDGARDFSDPMVNNAFVHVSRDGRYLGSILGKGSQKPSLKAEEGEDGPVSLYATSSEVSSLYVPAEADTSSVHFWYWPAHALQAADGTLYVAMTKFYQGGVGQWGFRYAGVDMLKADPETFAMTDRVEMFGRDCPVNWAQCLLPEGDDIWFYGTDGMGTMYAWKMDLAALEGSFAAHEGLVVTDEAGLPEGAVKCEVDTPVSAQFSVFRYKDKYVLLNKDRFSKGGEIYSYVSDSPQGPWTGRKLIWCTQEQLEDSELFTYNAMAHPQYINRKGELLICYNLNSYNVERIMTDVANYRPVFLRVPMKYILGD